MLCNRELPTTHPRPLHYHHPCQHSQEAGAIRIVYTLNKPSIKRYGQGFFFVIAKKDKQIRSKKKTRLPINNNFTYQDLQDSLCSSTMQSCISISIIDIEYHDNVIYVSTRKTILCCFQM